MLDARFSHLYFYQSLNRLQRGLSAIAELLVCLVLVETLKSLSYQFRIGRSTLGPFLSEDKEEGPYKSRAGSQGKREKKARKESCEKNRKINSWLRPSVFSFCGPPM